MSQASFAYIQKVTNEFYEDCAKQSKPYIRRVVSEGLKAGVPSSDLQYLFFTLFKSSSSWELPSRSKQALLAMNRLATQEGDIPNYRDGLTLPTNQVNAAVDRALKGLAGWVHGDLGKTLRVALAKQMDRFESLIPPDEEEMTIQEYTETLFQIAPLFYSKAVVSEIVKYVLGLG